MNGRRSGWRAARSASLIAAVFVFLLISRSEVRKTVPWTVILLLALGVWAASFFGLRGRERRP